GRRRELGTWRKALRRAGRGQRCAVVTVVGEAGFGTPRLGRGLGVSVGEEATVLVGRCVSYGAGATYLPIAEIVRQAVPDVSWATLRTQLSGEDDAEQVAGRVAEIIGIAEGPAAAGESLWAVRRLVEVVARERPLVVVLDDVHWAEPTLLDLVEYLGGWARGPLLLVCLARRELLESRASWGGPTSTGFVGELEPLGADGVTPTAQRLAGGP